MDIANPMGRRQLESMPPDVGVAIISFRDEGLPPAKYNAAYRLDIICNDIASYAPGLSAPSQKIAVEIVEFVLSLPEEIKLIVQCEAGIGRSAATVAALRRVIGKGEWKQILEGGTYNRRLYRLLCAEFVLDVPEDPLVGIACRIKYPLDRLRAFSSCMQRQRYDNWRCIGVSDGPLSEPKPSLTGLDIIETVERLGRWGHPYRQLGIEICLNIGAKYVGLANDDNYYVPGYLEQMIGAMQKHDADFAICQMLHSYSAWGVVAANPRSECADVGNWIASAELIRKVTWEGDDFYADGRYVERLVAASENCVQVNRPLMVKN